MWKNMSNIKKINKSFPVYRWKNKLKQELFINWFVDCSKDYKILNEWIVKWVSIIVWTTEADIARYLWLEPTEEEHNKYISDWEDLFKW